MAKGFTSYLTILTIGYSVRWSTPAKTAKVMGGIMLAATSTLQVGLAGMQAGLQQSQKSASQIAVQSTQPNGTDPGGLVEAAVGLIQAENQVAASAEVVKVSDDILGTLLDVRA